MAACRAISGSPPPRSGQPLRLAAFTRLASTEWVTERGPGDDGASEPLAGMPGFGDEPVVWVALRGTWFVAAAVLRPVRRDASEIVPQMRWPGRAALVRCLSSCWLSERGLWRRIGAGITIFGANNMIGGTTAGAGNVISGNKGVGVLVSDDGSSGNVIDDNWIGTDSGGLDGTHDPNAEGGIQFAMGASGNFVSGGTVVAGSSTFAIDAGGGANQVSAVSLGGGPMPLVIGGRSATVTGGVATSSAGGVSIPVTVTGAGAGVGVVVDLLDGSCTGNVAALTYIGGTVVQTDASGSGSGTVTASGDPPLPVFQASDSGGAYNLADPCPAHPSGPSACTPLAQGLGVPFAPTASDSYDRWVQAVFNDLLGRRPSPTELASFAGQLAGGIERSGVALEIESTPEYRARLITADFKRYLGRAPSATELTSDLSLFDPGLSQLRSDELLQTQILASNEYLVRAGANQVGFVDDAFCDLLGRSPTSGDLAALGPVLGGPSRAGLPATLLATTEYREVLARGWYPRFLRRTATSSDLSSTAALLASGATDEIAIAALVGSNEYFIKFGSIAVPPVTISPQAVVTVTVPRPATVDGQVFRLVSTGTVLPAGRPDLARPSANQKIRLPKLKLVGTVHFGRHRKGRVALHWNRKVGGHKLRRGTYELIIKLYSRYKLIGLSDRSRSRRLVAPWTDARTDQGRASLACAFDHRHMLAEVPPPTAFAAHVARSGRLLRRRCAMGR